MIVFAINGVGAVFQEFCIANIDVLRSSILSTALLVLVSVCIIAINKPT